MRPPAIPHPRCSLDVIFVYLQIFCSAGHQMHPWGLRSISRNSRHGWRKCIHLTRERIGMASEKNNRTRLPRRRQSVVMESETSQRTFSEAADELGRFLHSPKKTE
ncbi:hypothetical protein TNCV_3068711 [Trichonephila clavipes]|nr:hypothetical protein TNCV_3068711 [Trichonephila clavipes]